MCSARLVYAKGPKDFKVCWAGKLVIGDHVTGCAGDQQSGLCCKPFVMERSQSNFLFRAYVFANASAASEAIIGRRLGNLAMGSV